MQNQIVWKQRSRECVCNGFFLEEEVTHSSDLIQMWHGLGDAWRERKTFGTAPDVAE